MGSMSSPAFARRVADDARPLGEVFASVQGIGSRQGDPERRRGSHSAPGLSVSLASSGSLPATSALRARASPRFQDGAELPDRSLGPQAQDSMSSTRMPVSSRRASVSRMIGVSPIVS
jgi:hypothetical protein